VISKKRSFSGMPEYFQICPNVFQICPDNFQAGGHVLSSPTPMSFDMQASMQAHRFGTVPILNSQESSPINEG